MSSDRFRVSGGDQASYVSPDIRDFGGAPDANGNGAIDLLGPLSVREVTGSAYTFVLSDAGCQVLSRTDSAQTLTVPPQSSVAWATGAWVDVLVAGSVAPTIAAGVGVIVHAPPQGYSLTGVYQARLRRVREDVWDLVLSPQHGQFTQVVISSTGQDPFTSPPQGNTTPTNARLLIDDKYDDDRLVSPNPGYYHWGVYSHLVNLGTAPMTALNGRVRGNTAHAGGFTTRVFGKDPITHGVEIAMGAWVSVATATTTSGSPILTNIVPDTTTYEGSRFEDTMPIAGTNIPGATTILSITGRPGAPDTITMSANATGDGTVTITATPAGTKEVIGLLVTGTSGDAEADTSVGIQFQAQSTPSGINRAISLGASALRSTGIGMRFGLTTGDKGISFESTTFTNGLYFASATFTGPAIRFNSVSATMLGEFKGSTSDAVLYLKQTGSGDVFRANDMSSDASPVLINSSGMIVSGHTAALTYNGVSTIGLQMSSASANRSAVALGQWNSDNLGGQIVFAKSRSGTIGTHTIVQDGDGLGVIRWEGSDGTAFIPAANIRAEVDGTPGTGDMPTRLVFRTTADGGSTPGEAMRITNNSTIQHSSAPRTIVASNSHLTLRSYTVATLPSASTAAQLIYVSDGTSNKRMAVSDGSNWRFPDGAVVS